MLELTTTHNHLPALLHRLDEGWQIEEPLLQRSVLHGLNGRQTVLEVVLCRGSERHVVALCDDPDVQRFVDQRRYAIFEV